MLELLRGEDSGRMHPGSPEERRLAATAEDLTRALDALRRALETSGHLSIGSEIERVCHDLERVRERTIDDLARALAERAARQRMWRARERGGP